MPTVFLYLLLLMCLLFRSAVEIRTTCPSLEDYVKMCYYTSGSLAPGAQFIGQFEGCFFFRKPSVYTDTIRRKNKQRPSKQTELRVANIAK